MRKVFLIFALFLAIYAFKEISEFEKQVAGNFGYMLQNLPQEKVYLHTDKSTYTVGENVWFRAYQVHAAVNVPMVHSRFIYVDLVDKRDSLVRRVKVMERDSSFWSKRLRVKSNFRRMALNRASSSPLSRANWVKSPWRKSVRWGTVEMLSPLPMSKFPL